MPLGWAVMHRLSRENTEEGLWPCEPKGVTSPGGGHVPGFAPCDRQMELNKTKQKPKTLNMV